jgi:epoxyqueuosine reductase
MTRRELTEAIKSKALALGFTKVGVTSAAPFDEAADRFEAWVAEGSHGVMKWMERDHEKRRDVRNILPEAKSILSLALNYYFPDEASPPNPLLPAVRRGQGDEAPLQVSRYARGTDYHEIIPPMLRKLLDDIKQLVPEAEGRYYTDTGPLLEKAIAERAGIGWIGKHTNVITREVGSWVFLAEIILNIELEPDPPAEDMCGTCTRCLDACPTDALTAYKLDATKCISYLTIELKPEHNIEPDLASKMEGWIYGCDICQEVCPWNRFEQQSSVAEFAPRDHVLSLDENTIEGMAQEEFSARFRKSPVKRTKLAGLKRNLKAIRNQ